MVQKMAVTSPFPVFKGLALACARRRGDFITAQPGGLASTGEMVA